MKKWIDGNITNFYGQTSLHICSDKRYFYLCKLLIEKGTNINKKDIYLKIAIDYNVNKSIKKKKKKLIKLK